MPLSENGEERIRKNLRKIRKGRKAWPVVIGTFTPEQLIEINVERATRNLPAMSPEILFVGGHVYDGRITRDGYTIDDVVAQIRSALDALSMVPPASRTETIMQNQTPRNDGYGNAVRDLAVFECTTRHPRAELTSVIPKGDTVSPAEFNQIERDRADAIPVEEVTDLPG